MPTFFRPPKQVRSRSSRRWIPPSYTAAITTTLTLDVGSLTFAGQAITFKVTQAVDVGSLAFTGQAIDLTRIMPLTNAALSFTGQAHTFKFGLVVTAGALTFGSQSIDLIDLAESSASRAPLYLPARSGRLASIWKGIRGT